jgi:hypothetical protein
MTVEIFLASAGRESAIEAVQKRRSRSLDPVVADAIMRLLAEPSFVQTIEGARDWETMKALDPGPTTTVAADELDVLTLACADFTDLKLPGSAAQPAPSTRLACEPQRSPWMPR